MDPMDLHGFSFLLVSLPKVNSPPWYSSWSPSRYGGPDRHPSRFLRASSLHSFFACRIFVDGTEGFFLRVYSNPPKEIDKVWQGPIHHYCSGICHDSIFWEVLFYRRYDCYGSNGEYPLDNLRYIPFLSKDDLIDNSKFDPELRHPRVSRMESYKSCMKIKKWKVVKIWQIWEDDPFQLDLVYLKTSCISWNRKFGCTYIAS